jgi:hypothetical protein
MLLRGSEDSVTGAASVWMTSGSALKSQRDQYLKSSRASGKGMMWKTTVGSAECHGGIGDRP